MPRPQISVHASDILLKALAAYQESHGSKSRSEAVLELVILGIVTSDPAEFGEAQREWWSEANAKSPDDRISFQRWMSQHIMPKWGGEVDLSNRKPKAPDKPPRTLIALMRQIKAHEGQSVRYTPAQRRSIRSLIKRGLVVVENNQPHLTDTGNKVLERQS